MTGLRHLAARLRTVSTRSVIALTLFSEDLEIACTKTAPGTRGDEAMKQRVAICTTDASEEMWLVCLRSLNRLSRVKYPKA
ncbi:hypothetical protein PHLGIDRAFT_427417 [Phlebiopsis gigantea 11061_1 CR5-6]|uniref:Uncharacterized protein n=1 Tax=Phlebiopsis gigantea (strain 11061_1 CR5-6) TaxID=745531 RepID=A0A0C3PLC8_PHLG1|nr:hypothetical protein PHLGIDRAFT_427417 [Phlebiopsis gigantea 11061_1 CR5-6]